jgi:N-methylhydantoinase A
MRYYRQGYEIPVEIDPALLAGDGTAMLADRFNQLHEQFYRFRMEGTTCEIVNLRAIGYGDVPKPRLAEAEEGAGTDASHAVADEHEVYFGGEWLPTKIYDRARLRPGNRVDGPAVITEFDSTTVVLAGYAAEVDRYLNLIINPVDGEEAA